MITLSDWLGIAGLVLALPLGIVGSLLAPGLQRWWSKRSLTSRQRQEAARATDIAFVHQLAEKRAEMHEYLLSIVLRVAWVSAVFGATSGILFSATWLLPGLDRAAGLLGQLVAVVGAFVVVLITQQGFRIVRMVRLVDAGLL